MKHVGISGDAMIYYTVTGGLAIDLRKLHFKWNTIFYLYTSTSSDNQRPNRKTCGVGATSHFAEPQRRRIGCPEPLIMPLRFGWRSLILRKRKMGKAESFALWTRLA